MTDFVDYPADLGTLARLTSRPDALEDVLRSALASLHDVVPYDLAVVYARNDDRLVARAAVGPLADHRVRTRTHDVESEPSIARALEQREPACVATPEGARMLIPLFSGERCLGIIALERQQPDSFPPSLFSLAGVYGQIVAMAMLFAEQSQLLSDCREQLRYVLQRATIEPTPQRTLAPTSGAPAPQADPSLPDFAHMQRDYFRRVLERTRGRIYGRRGAAELVGLKPTTLQSRLKKLGIDPAPMRRRESLHFRS